MRLQRDLLGAVPRGMRTRGVPGRSVTAIITSAISVVALAGLGLAAAPAAHAAPSRGESVATSNATLPGIKPCSKMISRAGTGFRAWICDTGKKPAGKAASVLKLIEKYMPSMSRFMGGGPRPDSGTVADGGDKKIDVYLVNGTKQCVERGGGKPKCLESTTPAEDVPTDVHGTRASGFLLVDRTKLNSVDFASILVHELFHLLQSRYNTGDCGGGSWWFTEASATWAQTYWVPKTAARAAYPRYNIFEKNPEVSLLSTENHHDYASFVWPYFMQQQKGAASIARVWKSLPGDTNCAAMNDKLDAQLSFADNFRDFAVRNLDDKFPRDSGAAEWPQHFGSNYRKLHADFPLTWPSIQTSPQFTGAGQSESVKLDLPPLSATYAYVVTTAIGTPIAALRLATGGLSDTKGLSVDLLGYEGSQSGHNHWMRIRESSPGNGTCLGWDPGDTGNATLVLVISNSSLTQTVGGTAKIQTRDACATSASGTVTHTQQLVTDDTVDTVTTDTTVTMHLKLADNGTDGLVNNGSTFDYAVSGTQTDDVTHATCGFSGSGSGNYASADSLADLYGYQTPQDNSPYLTEVAAGDPLSGCGGGYELSDAAFGCPIVPPLLAQPRPTYEGKYSSDLSTIQFNCDDSSGPVDGSDATSVTEQVTGSLKVQGVIPCGLWTANCVNGALK
jgi:uncharacterized protein DUF6055